LSVDLYTPTPNPVAYKVRIPAGWRIEQDVGNRRLFHAGIHGGPGLAAVS